ncbi:hypothetical protein [Legionella sp.]|uniref:hypothetical protein n=1 Tax=Legionella sp. TaxID=459 RepID=UPI00321FDC62
MYFSFRQKKSGLFFNTKNYQWKTLSAKEAENAQEIAPILEQFAQSNYRYRPRRFFSNQLKSIFLKEKITSDFLKISLNDFSESCQIPALIHVIEVVADMGYCIAFDFNEIDLPSEGKSLSAEDKERLLKSVPYQVARALFNQFRPQIDADSSKTDKLIASQYTSIKSQCEKDPVTDLEVSLNKIPHFGSIDEAIIYHKITTRNQYLSNKDLVIVSFKLQNVSIDLESCVDYYYQFYSEIIIILQGKIYENPEERKQLSQSILRFLKLKPCTNFFHLFLLTKNSESLKTEDTLLSLAPVYHKEDDPFSPLPNGSGYYLSDPHVFASINEYIQEQQNKALSPECLIKAELSVKESLVEVEPDKISPEGYIYGHEPIEVTRASKHCGKKQLAAKAGLTFTYHVDLHEEVKQSQSLEQAQQLSKQQTLNQQRQQVLNQQVDYPFFTPPIPLSLTFVALQGSARQALKRWTKEKQLQEEIYYTSWYRTNFSARTLLKQLAQDHPSEFVAELVARTMGLGYSISPESERILSDAPFSSIVQTAKDINYVAQRTATTPFHFFLGKFVMQPLPGYSAESIEAYLFEPIFNRFSDFEDGLDPTSRGLGHSLIFRNSLMQGWYNVSTTRDPSEFDTKNLPIYVSNLGLRANRSDRGYQSHLKANFLKEYPSESLYLESLLEILTPSSHQSLPNRFEDPHYIASKEADFLALIKSAFPDHVYILNRLYENFDEHNLDNIRILLQFFISVNKEKFTVFLNYLVYLDQKCLLKPFYKIYFSYAPTIFSLANLFSMRKEWIATSHSHHGKELDPTCAYVEINEAKEACFLTLVERTPISSSTKSWPAYEKFAHSVLVFAAKHHMLLTAAHLEDIESFWYRVSAKFLAYSEGDVKQQQLLIAHFLDNLITEDGLSLARLRKIDTLLVCLENLLDHAIANHCLREQISELEDISLRWTDVPYATAYNGFPVVCKEMEIKAGSIGWDRHSYVVSLSELEKIILEFNLSASNKKFLPLKTAVFRYLGKETFREELNFYRKLYPPHDPKEPLEVSRLNQLIWAYYVTRCTGSRYNPYPEDIHFIEQCFNFLGERHPHAKKSTADKIILISRFLTRLGQTKTQETNGSLSLWALWQKADLFFHFSSQPIPKVLGYKFERNQLQTFLLKQSTDLKEALPTLLQNVMIRGGSKPLSWQQADRLLAESLIANLFDPADKSRIERCFQLLNLLLTPNFSLSAFLEQHLDMLILIENLKNLKNADSNLFIALQAILRKNPDVNMAITLVKLCRAKIEQNPKHLKPCIHFLQGLSANHKLLIYCTQSSSQLELVLDYCLNASADEISLEIGFKLANELRDDEETLKSILGLLSDKKVYAFFQRHRELKVPAPLLQKITKLLKETNNRVSVLRFIESVLEIEDQDPDSVIEKIVGLEANQLSAILSLCNTIYNQQKVSLPNLVDSLKKAPENCLQTLVHVAKHPKITIPRLMEVVNSSVLEVAIDNLEEELYEDDLSCYVYDEEQIKLKIAEIAYNSCDNGPPQTLSPAAQKALLRDYKILMGYIHKHPVYIENKDGISQTFTAHQLKSRHFPILFKALQARICRGENKKENQLRLLAISCVALQRTCQKFPRSTQLLPLLHSLDEHGQLVQELKTGAGKSIIAAIHAVLRVAAGRTALIPTENEELGRTGVAEYTNFYNYFDIPCGRRIIEAHSPYSDFVANGVNYSTPYGLALFFITMAIQKIRLAKNCDLIWDEIDASLTSTVPFRLAATLDPILLDTQSWSQIYNYILDFVREKELFLNNRCTQNADIHNFRLYFFSKNTDKKLTAFFKRVPDSFFNMIIDSARLAVQLEDKVDYMVVEKKEADKKSLYCAPFLPHTSRPEPRAGYGSGAQPILHAEKNRSRLPDSGLSFSVAPDTETVVTMTPKNLADLIKTLGGCLIGLTATPGMPNQLQEFRQLYDIKAVHYPSFYPDRCEDLGLKAADGWEDQKTIVLSLIKESREKRQNQPILIFCENALLATELHDELNSPTHPWQTQCYYGYSSNHHDEENFIADASNPHVISITTKCETRGADFDSEHSFGHFGINLCTHLTEEELVQIKGRVARNGKPGQFCSVIDVKQLGLQKNTAPEELAAAFKTFQQNIGIRNQKERAKTRLLEDARFFVTWHLFDLRRKADQILSQQQGQGYSLVPTLELMKTLRDLNKKVETFYEGLLKQDEIPLETRTQQFLEYVATEYNQILDQKSWLPNDRFKDYKPVEPLIPLNKLNELKGINGVKISQLLKFSELLSKGWEAMGNQAIQQGLSQIEPIMAKLDGYTRDQCGPKTIAVKMLSGFDLISFAQLIPNLESLEADCLQFLDELPTAAEVFISREKARAYVKKYFSETKTCIREERWDELALPTLSDDIFSSDDNIASSLLQSIAKKGIKSGMSGAFHLVIKLYVVPKITKIIAQWFPNDEETQIQLKKIMQEIEPQILDFLLAIPSSLQSEEGIWSLVFDKLLPILQHPSIKGAVGLFNKEGGKVLDSLLRFLEYLKPYRQQPLKELVSIQNLLPLIKQACQLDLVQLLVKTPILKEVLTQLSSLDSEFFSTFYHFDFLSLFHLVHLLAHPIFYNFLKALPAEANFGHLKVWLNSAEAPMDKEVKQARQELLEFQTNRERIEENNRLKLQRLKTKFTLTPEKLRAELDALKPIPEVTPIPKPASWNVLPWISQHPLQSLALLVVGLLLSWLILPIAFVGAVIYAGIVLYQKIQMHIEATKPLEEHYLEPITVYLNTSDQKSTLLPELDLEESEQLKISPFSLAGLVQNIDRKLPETLSLQEMGTEVIETLKTTDNPVKLTSIDSSVQPLDLIKVTETAINTLDVDKSANTPEISPVKMRKSVQPNPQSFFSHIQKGGEQILNQIKGAFNEISLR